MDACSQTSSNHTRRELRNHLPLNFRVRARHLAIERLTWRKVTVGPGLLAGGTIFWRMGLWRLVSLSKLGSALRQFKLLSQECHWELLGATSSVHSLAAACAPSAQEIRLDLTVLPLFYRSNGIKQPVDRFSLFSPLLRYPICDLVSVPGMPGGYDFVACYCV